MKLVHRLSLPLACVALLALSHAQAQVSREEVKAQARAANKAGETTQGEEPFGEPGSKSTSGKTRAQRKADTRAAMARGEINHGGEASPDDGKVEKTGAGRNRSDVKAETRGAVKSGKIPHGEQ